ncbi:hypothetical protein ACIBF1_45640 [Spirillospora sp. NPDC050679]
MFSSSPTGRLRPATVLAAAGVLLAGCSSGGSPETGRGARPVPDSPAPITSTPSPSGPGRLPALPMRAYMIDESQRHQLAKAEAVLTRACMKRFGFQYTPPALTSGLRAPTKEDSQSGELPMTDPKFAATHGYRDRGTAGSRPRPRLGLSEQGLLVLTGPEGAPPNRRGSGTAQAVRGQRIPAHGCMGEARRTLGGEEAVKTAFGDPELVTGIVLESYFRTTTEPRVKAVFGKWSACMKARGFDYASPVDAAKDPRWNVERPPDATEIQTAKADVACNRQHNVSGVFYAVQQAFQKASIEKNAQALQKIKADREAALAKTGQIIAAGQ